MQSRIIGAVVIAAAALASILFVVTASLMAIIAGIGSVHPTVAGGWGNIHLLEVALLAGLADLVIIGLLGKAGFFKAQAGLANLTVVAPSNVILCTSYYVLTPLRLVFGHLETWGCTWVISIFTIKPTFWKANWDQLLEAFPIGYKFILDLAGDTIPTDNILAMPAGSDEARTAIRTACQSPMMSGLRTEIGKVLSATVVQSFLFRLAFTVMVQPLLGWWLVGFTYVPFVVAGGEDSNSSGSATIMRMPKCKFLSKATKKYGEEGGWTACNNECMLGMDELFAGDYGLLSWHLDIRPDRQSGACDAVFLPGNGKSKCDVDIEDLR